VDQRRPRGTVVLSPQNDTASYCECDACEGHRRGGGRESGPVLRFVPTRVADNIKADLPERRHRDAGLPVHPQAAEDHQAAPERDRLPVSIECCFIHPFAVTPFTRPFRGRYPAAGTRSATALDLGTTSQLCPQHLARSRTSYVLKPNHRLLHQERVKGIYEESCYYTKAPSSRNCATT